MTMHLFFEGIASKDCFLLAVLSEMIIRFVEKIKHGLKRSVGIRRMPDLLHHPSR